MKIFILIFFVSLFSVKSFSQSSSGIISGTVKDTKNGIIAGATIYLSKADDSTYLKNGISDSRGRFQFNELQPGVYLLSITAIGQKKYTSSPLTISHEQNKIELPLIAVLPAKSVTLAEVVVKAKKPLMEHLIDRTIVNVDAMISSSTSNTLEVLEKTPGVSVAANGEISLNGRAGVLVLIDGRTIYMSAQDLASYLKSLPGGLLDKIELIDNPSAKYDAGGNAIINIRLKKNKIGGFTGNISVGYSQGTYARNNDAINLNYNRKKINLFANIGYNAEKVYASDLDDRRFYNELYEPVSTVELVNWQKNKNNWVNVNFGMDYAASPKTTYGFSVNLNQGKRKGDFEYSSDQYNADHKLELRGTGSTESLDKRTNAGANLNMLHKFNNDGKELSADLNYMRYNSTGDQFLVNDIYQPDGSLQNRNAFQYNLPTAIDIYTLKADYTQPLKGKAKLEAGFKSGIVDNNNVTDYYSMAAGTPTIDYSKSNHFTYHENINAAYVNMQKSWRRFGSQLGLRIENTRSTGEQLGNDSVKASRFTKDYTGLFPSIFLNYKLDTVNKNILSLILVKRINRPNYQSLNPFIYFKDAYSYTSGNPLLNPQYQYRVEVKLQHKQSWWAGISYNRFTDVIFQTTEAIGDKFFNSPQNIGKGYMLLLNVGVTVSPAKWWQLNTTARFSHMGLKGKSYTENLDFNTNVVRLEIANYFSIRESLKAELGGYYASRDLNGQAVTGQMYRVYASLQKKIMKDKGSIRLGFDDIFHSWVYKKRSISLKQAEYYQTGESDTQRIGIAFTYRFGQNTFARKRRHNDNAADDEKNRVE